MPTSKAPRIRRTIRSLKPPRSPSPTSATCGERHHADFKMRKPTLSAHAAGRHSTAVDHAARLPAQRGPWRAHGSHAQLSSPLHAARRHGLGPLIVGAVQLLPCFTRFEFSDRSFGAACATHGTQWPVQPAAQPQRRGRRNRSFVFTVTVKRATLYSMCPLPPWSSHDLCYKAFKYTVHLHARCA